MRLPFDLLRISDLLQMANRIIPFLGISTAFRNLSCLVLFSFFFIRGWCIQYFGCLLEWRLWPLQLFIFHLFPDGPLKLLALVNLAMGLGICMAQLSENRGWSQLTLIWFELWMPVCIFWLWGHIIRCMFKLEGCILHNKNECCWDCFPIHYQ